jgi:hypothetical protein
LDLGPTRSCAFTTSTVHVVTGTPPEQKCKSARLSRVKRAAAVAVVIVALSGCLGKFRAPLEQKTSHGPTARQFWTLKMMIANDREPRIEERRHWEDQLELQIEQYLRQNPEAANALHVTSFRYDKQVVTGMTKEQVLILLGAPEAVTADQAEMEKLARRYWKELQGNVTEAWVYDLGWRFFFSGGTLRSITQYLERS